VAFTRVSDRARRGGAWYAAKVLDASRAEAAAAA
jgi:hypothetical protein